MSLLISEIEACTILTPQKLGAIASGYDYSLNPYAGCAFSCSYCYVPKFPNARHQPAAWGKWLEVKINAPDLIRKERLKVFGSRLFFGSATDPYQYLELKYRLSRKCLQELYRYQPHKITIHTRSHLILQDLELLKAFGNKLKIGVSITTDNDAIRAEFEPSAPSVRRRVELLKKLHAAGVRVYASLAPLLPCNPEKLIALCQPYAEYFFIDEMRWLEVNNNPYLLQKYASFFSEKPYQQLCEQLRRNSRKVLK